MRGTPMRWPPMGVEVTLPPGVHFRPHCAALRNPPNCRQGDHEAVSDDGLILDLLDS
jgi:hypothetical protein